MNVEPSRFFRETRVTKPPGGDTADIFGEKTEDMSATSTPRKVKDYQKSTLFTPDANANVIKFSPRQTPNTQERLFGEDGNNKSPARKSSNTFQSRIFNNDEPANNAHFRTPKQPFSRNPITGETVYAKQPQQQNGAVGKQEGGVMNGGGDGYLDVNGAASNDHSSPAGTPKKSRVPPGGHSQPLF